MPCCTSNSCAMHLKTSILYSYGPFLSCSLTDIKRTFQNTRNLLSRLKMIKILFIQFVLMATYTCDDCISFNNRTFCRCLTPYSYHDYVCGTDDRTYRTPWEVRCERGRKYGKRINLQIKRWGPCTGGRSYGAKLDYRFIVSK